MPNNGSAAVAQQAVASTGLRARASEALEEQRAKQRAADAEQERLRREEAEGLANEAIAHAEQSSGLGVHFPDHPWEFIGVHRCEPAIRGTVSASREDKYYVLRDADTGLHFAVSIRPDAATYLVEHTGGPGGTGIGRWELGVQFVSAAQIGEILEDRDHPKESLPAVSSDMTGPAKSKRSLPASEI